MFIIFQIRVNKKLKNIKILSEHANIDNIIIFKCYLIDIIKFIISINEQDF